MRVHVRGVTLVLLAVLNAAAVLLVANQPTAAAEPKTAPAKTGKKQPLPRFSVHERTLEPLMVADQRHEDFCLNYFNVIHDGDQWQLWYTAYDHNYRDDNDGNLCYAQSKDGVRWEKPVLGLFDYDGDRYNNIVALSKRVGGLHGQTVFLDPAAPKAERYKMVYSRAVEGKWQVFGAHSAEGIIWWFDKQPLLKFNSDTQTVCFPDEKLYRLYVRMWTGGDFKGLRSVGYSQSKTFSDFSAPVEILAPSANDPPNTDLYNNAASKLGPQRYVMFPSVFTHGKVEEGKDVVLPHLAFSRDGRTFARVADAPLVSLGRGFDSKCIYVCPGGIPADRPNSWWFYYLGLEVGHDQTAPSRVHGAGGVGRFLLTAE